MRTIALILIGLFLPQIAHADRAKPQHRDAVIERMAAWEALSLEDWPKTQAPTIMGLLEPMLGGFPSRTEGRPSIAITVRKLEEDTLMLAHVRMRGFLDDSVNGEEFTALIDSVDGSWTLIALWRRHECARGLNEGRWITAPCP